MNNETPEGVKCENCDGTGKVPGNPIWHHGNYWIDKMEWCKKCEGEGVIEVAEDD